MEHKLGGSKAILVVPPLVALMEDQVYILKKHGVRTSILGSSTSVAKENIATVALAETIFLGGGSGSPNYSEVARCL